MSEIVRFRPRIGPAPRRAGAERTPSRTRTDVGVDQCKRNRLGPPDDTQMPGGMYRNQVWFPYPGSNVVLCQGMCGQMIYINRAAEMVAAKLSTQSDVGDPQMLLATLRAFDAVAYELARNR